MNDEILDCAALMEELDGDYAFLNEALKMLKEDAPKILTDMRAAITQNDSESLWKLAHSMKSMVGNFYARRSYDLAYQIEKTGRQDNPENANEAVNRLVLETQRLVDAIEELVDQAQC